MGVDIQTYRARIGNYKHSRCDETIENFRQPSGCNVAVTDINVSNRLKTVGCVLFICVLLIIAGIEQNPGPVEKGSESCQSDEAAAFAKGADIRTDDSAPKLHHADPTHIKISGLMENMNKKMLEMFFDKEERDGGGKVKSIDLDSKNKCAIVEFEDETGVDLIMKKAPMAIFGLPVRIEVMGGDTEKTKMIKISKLPAALNKEMLLMFIENMMESDEKVVDVTVNAEDSHAIVEFDSSAAVQRVLDQKPLNIFGFEVDVDTFVPDMPPVFEPLDIPRIRISGLMENTNKEMLAMFFELEYRNGEGKVKNIDIDKKRKFAIIEFEEKAGAEAFLLRNPKSILGMDVMVEVIDTTSDKSQTRSKRIKITGLAENTNKEMLEMFFETEERNGGGKVNNIFIDGNNRCARIEFEDETGVEWIMNKTPISIFGVEVGIETLGYIDEPKKIQITNLPVSINKEMLRMFFDNKIDFGGKVIDISIKSEENMAIVEFGDSTAVYRIMENRPLTILGFNVDVDVFDMSHVAESLDIPRIGIFGLQEDTNNEMLAMYFQHDERKGGGKVKNIEINHKGKFATIDFEEKAGADAFLLRNPKSILGIDVTVKAIDTTSDKSQTKSTRIKITGLAENVNKEMLEMFFKIEERNGGGKVNNIFIDGKNRCVLIEFEDETGADRILKKTPTLILGKEVEIERIDDIDQPKKIQITKMQVCMTEDMLKMFFEDKTDFGGKVIDISITPEENKAIVEFDTSTAVYRIMDVRPLTILGCNVDVDIFETEYAGGRMQGIESLQTTEPITAAHAETVPSEFDEKEPHSSYETDIVGSTKEIFGQMLAKFGLIESFPGKISIRDIVAVDTSDWNKKGNGTICSTDIPWLVLKRLISSHSECRDISVTNDDDLKNGIDLENTLSFLSDMPDDKQDISPLDIFFIIFQCCDPFLKQVFVQKLYLCKIAVPFLYKYGEKHVSVLSVWPLRSLAIENKQKNDGNSEIQCNEIDVLELPTKMIAFGRLGRPRYSKSKLINSILSDHGCKTFFNFDSPSGMTKRTLSNGQIEMFWLPLIGDKKDRFQEAITFFNLRGDLEQHFDAEIQTFISAFVDTLTIIVDIENILKRSRHVNDILLKFSSVILIIPNPITQETIQEINDFKKYVSTSNPQLNLRVLSTHKGSVEQNAVDMVTFMSVHMTDQLKSSCTKSYHERLHQAKVKIRIDEDDENCQIGKKESNRIIKQMNFEGLSYSWKQSLTPVHSKFSKELGKLIKMREREKGFEGGNAIDAKIKTVREAQIKSITKSVKLFTYMLTKYENNLLVLKYFLCWLHFHIEREKRQSLPQLMNANRLAWKKLKLLKSNENQVQSDIVKQENTITELEERIDEASFSIEHFFREIGHINEAILELGKDFATLELPQLCRMANIIGRLVADGHQIELIDGESFYMPFKWIKAVVNKVDQYIGEGKVLALSVLGLQSSGKSTFLNTMFGCQFSTRTGRCTRGIHAQLIPVNTKKFKDKLSDYNFILVVDTEGLRSPELSHFQHEHDNELATAITGIGDMTLINIMGENTSEIRDILQVIVHAFLRLKMTNKELDIKKSCSFIHQNVTDTSASENMMSGLSKLIQTLDEMTKESAESEHIKNITTFNQVIQFDINSQVWYLKNLWQGNPPMARVNTEYSERVVDIKSSILKKALTMKDKSYKSLNDITEHAHNLWKGVLNEDFVFSFRNSIEIKAYMAMEYVVQEQLWRLESLIRDKLIHISQNRFANCDQEDNLNRVADTLTSDINELLLAEKGKSKEVINEYFKKDKYKDIIIQWQKSQEIRFDRLCEKLEKSIQDQINKDLVKREVEILTVTCQAEHEEELRRMSMKVANENRGKTLSRGEIDHLFDTIWQSFVKKVNNPSSNLEKDRSKMCDIFYTCLVNLFKNHFAVLKEVLGERKRLSPIPNLTTLKGTFSQTGIDKNDISLSTWQRAVDLIPLRTRVMKNVKNKVNEVFEMIDIKAEQICQVREEITEMDVNQFLHDIGSRIDNMFKGNTECEYQIPFYVKLYVHISRHAYVVLEKHNENYFNTYGAAARLKSYKVQQKISFEAHLSSRYAEDVVSKLFINIIESFALEWTSKTLPNRVTDDLYVDLPSVKNRAIIEICTDLLEKNDFDSFIRYIRAPRDYASSWITHKANHVLFAQDSRLYAKISSSILSNLFLTVKECVQNIYNEYKSQSCISIDEWVKYFQGSMKGSGFFIPTEKFRSMRKETDTIKYLENLTDKILESLKKTEADLVSRSYQVGSDSVQWEHSSPIERLIQKIWGCQEQCVFCGEPCTKNEDHAGSDHNCMQHRPLCCIGLRYSHSEVAELASCEFNVQSEITHVCAVFDYKCNTGKREKCSKESHHFKNYKTVLNEWYIAPSANMHDTSRYWMWFVATYKDKLIDCYQYKLDNIPSSWKDITKSAAIKSLSETYSV